MKTILLFITLALPINVFAAKEGDRAPNFALPVLNSNEQHQLTNYLGKVVYLDFWASWCAPCRVSFPEIIQLKADLSNKPFEVIAINVDENSEDARRFLRRYKVPYPILWDENGEWASQYKLPGMPTAFVIDRQGVIQMRHSGFRPGDMKKIRSKIDHLLEMESAQ